jgi:hypothetical protein
MSFFKLISRAACESCESCESAAPSPADSQYSQHSQGVSARRTDPMQRLRDAAGDRWDMIRRMDHGAPELLESMPDLALKQYAIAATWGELIRQGIAPPEFDVVRACPRCGPVPAPPGLDCDKGCPWCRNRRARLPIASATPCPPEPTRTARDQPAPNLRTPAAEVSRVTPRRSPRHGIAGGASCWRSDAAEGGGSVES